MGVGVRLGIGVFDGVGVGVCVGVTLGGRNDGVGVGVCVAVTLGGMGDAEAVALLSGASCAAAEDTTESITGLTQAAGNKPDWMAAPAPTSPRAFNSLRRLSSDPIALPSINVYF